MFFFSLKIIAKRGVFSVYFICAQVILYIYIYIYQLFDIRDLISRSLIWRNEKKNAKMYGMKNACIVNESKRTVQLHRTV